MFLPIAWLPNFRDAAQLHHCTLHTAMTARKSCSKAVHADAGRAPTATGTLAGHVPMTTCGRENACHCRFGERRGAHVDASRVSLLHECASRHAAALQPAAQAAADIPHGAAPLAWQGRLDSRVRSRMANTESELHNSAQQRMEQRALHARGANR